MKWPWQRQTASGTLVVGMSAEAVAWVHRDHPGAPVRCGLEVRAGDEDADLARRIRSLRLPTRGVTAVLPLQQSQLLQIEAPGVRPEELRAATRWRIKDQVEGRVDQLTIDVMPVGDAADGAARQLFVVAAPNQVVGDTAQQALAMGWEIAVIDVAETVQRNLQSAVVAAAGFGARATAGLMRHGSTCLLTFCAGGELFHARRLEWDGALERSAPSAPAAPRDLGELDFVDYGAEDADAAAGDDADATPLVIELQRSFDVWEHTWPDRPLAGLWVQAGETTEALTALLRRHLGLPVQVLDPSIAFAGSAFESLPREVLDAAMPLLGGLLRAETRQL